MQAGFRLIAMVLVLTLAGGAQACLALCAAPTPKPALTAKATPEKTSCHHCPVKSPAKPTNPEPTGPCKQCQTATQDRLATERDHSVLKAVTELTFLPYLDLAPTLPTADRAIEFTHPLTHSPPSERLHQFCLLLI